MNSPLDSGSTLVALSRIETLSDRRPLRIVPLAYAQGTAIPAEELMAARVKWVTKVGYRILTESVPAEFWPYNTVIRLDERNTEDHNLDYLAQFTGHAPDEA